MNLNAIEHVWTEYHVAESQISIFGDALRLRYEALTCLTFFSDCSFKS
jgi:hypothetical protein